ncbi:hypothetical protein DIPPA_22825 [Diplonema papillatum]|nr:hypothetical protein DIPPA_22825 [Diplonema papillatum]
MCGGQKIASLLDLATPGCAALATCGPRLPCMWTNLWQAPCGPGARLSTVNAPWNQREDAALGTDAATSNSSKRSTCGIIRELRGPGPDTNEPGFSMAAMNAASRTHLMLLRRLGKSCKSAS